MLSTEQVTQLLEQGGVKLKSLTPEEAQVFEDYCIFLSTKWLETCARNNRPIEEAVATAYRYGVAWGLGCKIENNQLKVR